MLPLMIPARLLRVAAKNGTKKVGIVEAVRYITIEVCLPLLVV